MTQIVVLIDWQNAYQQARNAFGLDDAAQERGTVSPLKLAQVLAQRSAGHRARLIKIEVHRGLPDPRRQRTANSAALRQRDAWEAEAPGIVVPKLRSLAYNPDTGEPEEKGVDVAIAVSSLEWTITARAERVIIFWRDSDLLPGIDTVCRLYGADKIQTASWWSRSYWKRIPETPGVKNLGLDEETFLAVETPVDYRPPPGGP